MLIYWLKLNPALQALVNKAALLLWPLDSDPWSKSYYNIARVLVLDQLLRLFRALQTLRVYP